MQCEINTVTKEVTMNDIYQLECTIYCRVNQEWQWRNILFSIVKFNINLYTPLELTGIDRSHVY